LVAYNAINISVEFPQKLKELEIKKNKRKK